MTDIEQPPQNGIDLSAAEDDDHNKSRPADIEQDMREMERRKRVEAIMSSRLFREELERIVDSARDGGTNGILQQLSDIVGLPASRVGSVFKASNCMMPINDIRGVESMGYAKGEKILRCKLAATFRLLDLYGWTQGLGAQITARLKVDQEYFLVNPFGMLYHEITASSLNKIDMQGQIVEQGTTNFGVNKNHFVLHSIVHAARPDIRCAIYIGCSAVVAISSLKTGILPITKDACVLGDISTHHYSGSLLDEDERNRLVRNLGPNSKVMLLTNHGALCCGETIEEAFFAACSIVRACETQLKLLPIGLDNLQLIPEESRKVLYDQARRPPEDLEKKFAAVSTEEGAQVEGGNNKEATTLRSSAPKWRVGGAEFEALMRMLDNAGYRTGYIYRHPLIKSDPPKPKNDVELPPAVSSLGYLLEEEELFRQGIWKKGDLRKGGDRSRWLNSPNVYQKVEVLETGTPDPKKITKWVAEGSPTHSTPIRIEDPLQFVPGGTTTKEFKRLQQQIKDNRRADKISAGPQSHILEGVTWDEANRIKDATVSSAGDHVVLMGAASKGIIQRGYQHNATVYKAPYAKNPFDNVTDDEINDYKRTVERKKKSIHGEYTDTDFSESEALSSLPTSGAQHTKQTTTTTAAVSQSEPEDISEHQVMRIQTQQAPVPSQPEVVLSDAPQAIPIGNAGQIHFVKAQVHQSADGGVGQEENIDGAVPNTKHSQPFIAELNARLFARRRSKIATPTASDDGLYVDIQTDDHDIAIDDGGQELISVSAGCKCNMQEATNESQICEYHQHLYEEIDGSSDSLEVLTGCKRCGDGIYKKSRSCNTPAICDKIFESMRKPTENNLILNVPFMPTSPVRDSHTLKLRPTKANNKPNTLPHRTNWHYGFNSPKTKPQPNHKHLPCATEPQKYVPLGKSTSFEEFFSSPRYADLCDRCFERLLRYKPDIANVRVRLRNLCHIDDENKTNHYDYADCSSSEDTDCLCAPPPNSRVDTADNLSSVSNSSFIQKIQRMNYSEESANSNFQPSHLVTSNISLIDEAKDNTNAKPLEAISEALYESFQSLNDVDSGHVQGNAIVTEIWEFGDWIDEGRKQEDETKADKTLTPEGAGTKSVESIHKAHPDIVPLHVRYADDLNDANTRRRLCFGGENEGNDIRELKQNTVGIHKPSLMSRQERTQRTAEFHELWDDHISAKRAENECSSDSENESPVIKPISVRTECKKVFLEEAQQACQVRFDVHCGLVKKTSKVRIEGAFRSKAEKLALPPHKFDDRKLIVEENVSQAFFREKHEIEIPAPDTVLPGAAIHCFEPDVTNYIDDTNSFVEGGADEVNVKVSTEAKSEQVMDGVANEDKDRNMYDQLPLRQTQNAPEYEQSIPATINASADDTSNSDGIDADSNVSMKTLVNRSNEDGNALLEMSTNRALDGDKGAVGYAASQDTAGVVHGDRNIPVDLRKMPANACNPGSQWPEDHITDTRSLKTTSFNDPNDVDDAIDVLESNIDLNQPCRPPPFGSITTVYVNNMFKNLQGLKDKEEAKETGNEEPSDTEQHLYDKRSYRFDDTGCDADEDTPNKSEQLESRAFGGLDEAKTKHRKDYKKHSLIPFDSMIIQHYNNALTQEPEIPVRRKRKYKKNPPQNENDIQTYNRLQKYWKNKEKQEIVEKIQKIQKEDNDDESHLNSIERTILQNIEMHGLKKSDQIYVKIEDTIRNKLTPSRLESLLEKEKRSNTSWQGHASSPSNSSNLSGELLSYSHTSGDGGKQARNKRRAVSKSALQQESATPLRRSKSLGHEHKPDAVLPANEKLAKSTSPRKSRLDALQKRRYLRRENKNSPDFPGKRNFILENIRNAAVPRTQSASSRKHESPRPVSSVSPHVSPQRKKRTTSAEDDCAVYSFQSKVVGSSPKLWVSMRHSPSRQLQLKKMHNNKRRKNNRASHNKLTPHQSQLSAMNSEDNTDYNYTDNTEPMDGAYGLTKSTSAQTFTIESEACMDVKALGKSISDYLDSDGSNKENIGKISASTSTSTFIVRTEPGNRDPRLRRPTIDLEELNVGSDLADVGFNLLGERLQQIEPRLETYKLNVEDYGEHVDKCTRAMDECMAMQAEIAEEQLRLREALRLAGANEQPRSHGNSISETED